VTTGEEIPTERSMQASSIFGKRWRNVQGLWGRRACRHPQLQIAHNSRKCYLVHVDRQKQRSSPELELVALLSSRTLELHIDMTELAARY
jgi:hypothetical protein